jgi:hypothetical protein
VRVIRTNTCDEVRIYDFTVIWGVTTVVEICNEIRSHFALVVAKFTVSLELDDLCTEKSLVESGGVYIVYELDGAEYRAANGQVGLL